MEEWRLILDDAQDAFHNMAVDETIFRSFHAVQLPPTIRFYTWRKPSISLGRFQKIDDLNMTFCEERAIDVVRRPTGGRAVLHGTDLTFSIVKRNDSRSVKESYKKLGEAVAYGLSDIGTSAQVFQDASSRADMRSVANCFDLKAAFEVAIDGCKILGSAQVRNERAVLQQNSLLLKVPSADNLNAFIGGNSEVGAPRAAVNVDKDIVIESLCKAIERTFRVKLCRSSLTEDEENAVAELVLLKYGTNAWNLFGCRDFVDTPTADVIY